MMKYLDEGELSDDEIESGLQSAISSGRAFPVFVGSAYKNYGTSAILDSLIVDFPAPNKVTLPHALRGESDFELKSDTTGPLAAYVFKTAADPFAGRISFLRVYSGSLHSASEVTNSKKGVKERIGNLFVMVGKQQDSVDAVKAGDIIQVAKLHDTTTCDTLSTANDKIIVSSTAYPEPMLSFSIAPATKGEDDKLAQGMHRFIDEDPTLRFEQDPETHEAIIAGMGEVQIDVVRDRLK
jgi:elongation factor G